MTVSRRLPGLALAAILVVAGCGATVTPGPDGQGTPDATATPSDRPTATPTPTPTPRPEPSFPVAVVAAFTDPRTDIATKELSAAVKRGDLLVTCGLTRLELDGTRLPLGDPEACVASKELPADLAVEPGTLGLLPAGLVTPATKVLRLGGADPFGSPSRRAKVYPLVGRAPDPPKAWLAHDVDEVRTLVSTGDTCPDRGVSYQANVLGKGWDWVLDGGTAHYTGVHMDRRFSGPTGNGWPVPDAVRQGDRGAVRALLADADVTVNDFECPMVKRFTQNRGTIFSIDPRVAPLLASAGVDAVTLGSNHVTDRGADGVAQTLAYLEGSGIAHAGAGMDLDEALAPAVVEVRGLRFAFVGWDSTGGSRWAGPSTAGAAAMTSANVKASLAAARKAGDVVIAMPQWNWPEYHAGFTATALKQRAQIYAAGADHILGSGTHWAGAISITEGERGPQLAVTSHGNFLFGQDWSRQTMEGVIVEMTFLGRRLVQVRLHPYVVMDQAQPNLIDPETDGAYVLGALFEVSELP